MGEDSVLILPPSSPLHSLADKPALVVLLRSFGCTFCREAMADVSAAQAAIEGAGASIAFVHGASRDDADPWFRKYGLTGVLQISDPDLEHYRAFDLGRTGVQALFEPTVWARGAVCAITHGFGAQSPIMMRQLPGIFVVQGGEVLASYRHRSPADRPDYLQLVRDGVRDAAMKS